MATSIEVQVSTLAELEEVDDELERRGLVPVYFDFPDPPDGSFIVHLEEKAE